MKELPPALDRVVVPELPSPSQLAFGGDCMLRVVLGSRGSVRPALGAHPAAELGRIFHRVLELASRGEITRAQPPTGAVRATLEELLAHTRERLAADPLTESFADLSRTLAPLTWHRKIGAVVEIGTRLLAAAPSRSPGARPNAGGRSFETLPDTGVWAEVTITARQLRLAGRIDLVEKTRGATTVRDLKSGRIEDRDGQLLPHVDLQLRLYGVMVAELCPESSVRLIVDDGTEHDVPFDLEIAANTREWLSALLEGLGPNSEVIAAELASPGDPCGFCPYRPECASYLRAAPSWWRIGSTDPLPHDIWRIVEDLSPQGAGLVDVTMRDDAGRRVKVFGVQGGRLNEVRRGEQIYFFGLRTQPQRDRDGSWRHPRNFHEITEYDPRDRAWSLEVFRRTNHS